MNECDEFDFNYEDDLEALIEQEKQDGFIEDENNLGTISKTPVRQPLPSPQLSQIGVSASRPLLDRILNERGQHGNFASTPYPMLASIVEENENRGARKRRLELDLFGDTSDLYGLDGNTNEHLNFNAKKSKNEEERDLELIETILNARKRLESNATSRTNANGAYAKLELIHSHKLKNLSRIAPKWPFLRILNSDNDRHYVRFHSEEYEAKEIYELKQKNFDQQSVFGEKNQQIWLDAQKILNRHIDINNRVDDRVNVRDCSNMDNGLWVEKYKPIKYIDLLSDESCNRNFLKWLKLWDTIVFGKPIQTKANLNLNAAKLDNNNKKELNTFNKKTGRFENRINLNTMLDEFNCPIQKVILLAGPPGIGKTTLAHVIAKHAGYQAVEINASDDRTVDAFRQALENGTQMQSVLTMSKRPNCIILDEIDGAPSATIDFLVKFVSGVALSKGKKGQSHTKSILRRPIVCICNDLYAISLRQLRSVAFVLTVPPTDNSQLANRLLHICRKERIKTNLSTLYALVDKSGNDIRTCLSVIQFLSRPNNELALAQISNTNIGIKDLRRELFQMWTAIFQIPRSIKSKDEYKRNDSVVESPISSDYARRMKYVIDMLHMTNEYDKLMQGVFENYLHQKLAGVECLLDATSWFAFNDQLLCQINREQCYATYMYLPFAFASWHLSLATMAWPKINYPHKNFTVVQKINATQHTLNTLMQRINPKTRGIVNTTTCIYLNSILYVRHILSPQVRSVSMQLLTTEERTEIQETVQIMIDLGLSYIQLRTADGSNQFNFLPNIDDLFQLRENSIPIISNWCKQLIAREIDLAKIHQNQIKQTKENVPNFLVRLQCKKVSPKNRQEEIIRKDFFGRIEKIPVSQLKEDNSTSASVIKGSVWYSYKEGFNNAVRKNVTIADLV